MLVLVVYPCRSIPDARNGLVRQMLVVSCNRILWSRLRLKVGVPHVYAMNGSSPKEIRRHLKYFMNIDKSILHEKKQCFFSYY